MATIKMNIRKADTQINLEVEFSASEAIQISKEINNQVREVLGEDLGILPEFKEVLKATAPRIKDALLDKLKQSLSKDSRKESHADKIREINEEIELIEAQRRLDAVRSEA